MYVENILTVFNLATPEEVADGIKWYADAQAAAKRIAIDLGVPLQTVVGVIAALSPNNRWERNLIDARNLIAAYLDGEAVESVAVSTYHKMREKAWSIVADALTSHTAICERLRGQKIISFFCNIMGADTCTIDGHALNIARGQRESLTSDKTNIGKVLYRELQAAYVEAGKAVTVNGRPLKAFEMQAITWVTWRRLHNI